MSVRAPIVITLVILYGAASFVIFVLVSQCCCGLFHIVSRYGAVSFVLSFVVFIVAVTSQ
ncbi:hypothetical protein B0H10DRAFT_2051939 [Mycena sp. CBHHK59/15]|nr:hypothetical protein B0H10DRAFT_2051939 [Mycena sp. CBHHK59/15]